MKPFVSVIIPTYNRGYRIKYCIDSILEQTFTNYEIIVIDDNSSDNTWQIIKKINDERVKYFKLNKNHGAQYARNYGIKISKGEWITFLDSDDEWMSDKLEKQVNALKFKKYNSNVVIYTHGIKKYDSGKTELMTFPDFQDKETYSKALSGFSVLFQSLMVSKSALTDIGFLDEGVATHQEWDTTILLAKKC